MAQNIPAGRPSTHYRLLNKFPHLFIYSFQHLFTSSQHVLRAPGMWSFDGHNSLAIFKALLSTVTAALSPFSTFANNAIAGSYSRYWVHSSQLSWGWNWYRRENKSKEIKSTKEDTFQQLKTKKQCSLGPLPFILSGVYQVHSLDGEAIVRAPIRISSELVRNYMLLQVLSDCTVRACFLNSPICAIREEFVNWVVFWFQIILAAPLV